MTRSARRRLPRALLGLTGLEIDGGIASVARCVTRALDERASAGRLDRVDRVLLLDDPGSPPAPPPRGIQRLAGGRQALFALQLWLRLWRSRPDLLFFDQLGPARSVGLPLPGFGFWRGGLRYAVFCHGIELDRAIDGDYRQPLLHAWRVLVNSEHTGRRVRARFPEVAERVRVVPLCIDPQRTEAWQAADGPDADPPAPPRQAAALIVGRMVAEERGKGHDTLLDAWPRVLETRPDAQLWVVGGGDDAARLERRAIEAGLAQRVRFLGRLPDDELAQLYRRASVFAMPSRQEGFGLVYAEAMWHGLPCIASNADAGAEVVRDGETGVIVPYGDVRAVADAIASLFADPARVAVLGEAGRRRARAHYAFPRFRDDLLAALELD